MRPNLWLTCFRSRYRLGSEVRHRSRRARRLVGWVAASGPVAVAVVGGSIAWACVPQPLITLSPMASGTAGTEVMVNGYSVNGRAELRWNALDGPLLATAQGPTFSAPVKIPPGAPGLYTVLVLQRDATGAIGSTGRAAFEVISDSPPPPGPVQPPTTVAAPRSSSTSVPAGTAALGGAALLSLGALGGTLAARRRSRRQPTPSDPEEPVA